MTIAGVSPATVTVVVMVNEAAIKAVAATEEEDIHQTTEALMENVAEATGSAEVSQKTRKTEKEEHHTDVRPSVRAVHLTVKEGATVRTATMMEATGGHPMAVHHSDSAEVMAAIPKEMKEDPTDRAVHHSVRDDHLMAKGEATAAFKMEAKEDLHIQGNLLPDADSGLSREDSPLVKDLPIRGLKNSDAKTSHISQRLTRQESIRCFQESRRLTLLCPTMIMFQHLSRKKFVSISSSQIQVSAHDAKLTTSFRPEL